MSPRVRPLALGVIRRVRDGALLVFEGFDSVKAQHFYRPLGGEIEFGELAEQALRREFREEIDATLEDVALLGLMENIFTWEGKPGHELIVLFSARISDPMVYETETLSIREGDTVATAMWKRLDEFSHGSVTAPLYPDGLAAFLAGCKSI